jgi:hypothetical protein
LVPDLPKGLKKRIIAKSLIDLFRTVNRQFGSNHLVIAGLPTIRELTPTKRSDIHCAGAARANYGIFSSRISAMILSMRMVFTFACVLSVSAAVAQNPAESSNTGVIYGMVTANDGLPAKGLVLNAAPLGHPLAMALPWTKTDEVGGFRFEHLPLGRYTVFAEDKGQGYSSFSTGTAGQGNPAEVELTTEHSEAEFNLRLPPKAGFLLFHLTNRTTGASIFGVEVTVMSAENPAKFIFSSGQSSSEPVLVPSDKNLLLHVKSWGFREWDQSVGNGKPVRIPSGERLTLDAQLQPANPITERIPNADPKKYQGIIDEKDWKNPCLLVRTYGVVISGVTRDGNSTPVTAIAEALEALPDSAWPYGRVVAVEDDAAAASEVERSRIEANRMLLEPLLGELGVIVGFRPSAGACEAPGAAMLDSAVPGE